MGKIRSGKRHVKPERVDIFIKREEQDEKIIKTSSNQHKRFTVPRLTTVLKVEEEKVNLRGSLQASVVKVEENDVDMKLPRAELEEDNPVAPDILPKTTPPKPRARTTSKPRRRLDDRPRFDENTTNYCYSCDKFFPSEEALRVHLEIPQTNPLPGIEKPTFNCNFWEVHQCRTLSDYLAHLGDAHSTKPARKKPISDPSISMDALQNPKNQSGVICKLTLSTRGSYMDHMKNIHNRGKDSKVYASYLTSPDPNQPNFGCTSCKSQYRSRASLHKHIRLYHHITIEEEDD